MKAAKFAAAFLFLAFLQTARAQNPVQQAQTALKEQGFYYGQITGQKDADTVAAIRRFQIRSGLQVTGELNDETLRALRANPASSTGVQSATPPPAASPRAGVNHGTAPTTAPPAPSNGELIRPTPKAVASDIFSNTPYVAAPPELQQRVIRGAQTILRQRGFFKSEVDGEFGREMEFSLRALQSSIGISPSGKLDMETLSALGLLPGQHGPRMSPRRRLMPNLRSEPPVRGKWIREREPGNDD